MSINIDLNDCLQEVKIRDRVYTLDIYDYNSLNALTRFKEKHVSGGIDENLLSDCEVVIDTILGKGTYRKIFGDKKTMKAYLLVNELASIYLDLFMKDEREKEKLKNEQEIEEVSKLMKQLSSFMNTMKYAENKYGMRNHVSQKSSKKH